MTTKVSTTNAETGKQKKSAAAPRKPSVAGQKHVDAERDAMIAEAAYYRAEARNFCGGAEEALADWVDAEAEIDGALRKGRGLPKHK